MALSVDGGFSPLLTPLFLFSKSLSIFLRWSCVNVRACFLRNHMLSHDLWLLWPANGKLFVQAFQRR